MRSAPTITFEARPSRLLLAGVVGMAALAVLAIWLSRLPWAVAAAASACVIVLVIVQARRMRKRTVQRVAWQSDDNWILVLDDDEQVQARLCGSRVLGPMIVLRFSWARTGRVALFLTPDNLDADLRRRLRMRLSAQTDSA